MSSISTEMTVGTLVAEKPALSRVFEALKIDYCCAGKQPLSDACAKRGLDPREVVRQLEAAALVPGDAPDCLHMTLTELADHIEATHHAYLRRELPRLTAMIAKVASVHGESHAWMYEVKSVFAGLVAEMEAHMMKEEQILFPMIRALDRGERNAASHCGSIANPIRVMEHEHENAGAAVATIRELSQDFTPPEGACNTFRAMLDGLQELEQDLHRHVHKENSILFPRSLAAESA